MRRLLLGVIGLLACTRTQQQPGVQGHVALHQVDGCPEVTKAVQDAAVNQMRQDLENAIRGSSRGYGIAAAGASPAAAPGASAPAAYTTTNVQVQGVDEPDVVKTDGTRIFALSGGKLFAAGSWPAASLAVTGEVEIEGWPTGMYLDSGRIAVLSAVPPARDPDTGMGLCPVASGPSFMCGYFGPSTTKLTLIDAATLEVTGEVWLPGNSWHSRRVGSRVYVVLTDPARWPTGIKWWPDGDVWKDPERLASAIHALEDANEKLIRGAPLSSWLPPAQRKLAGGETVDVPWDCTQFSIGNAPVRLGFATVASLDLDHPDAAPARTTILGQTEMVYASQQSLYLLNPHWWWWDAEGNADWSYVHRFDISQPGAAKYLASGSFEGRPVDSYSLDEDQGSLRAAVNTVTLHRASDGTFRLEMSSFLRVLDDQLQPLASIELAKGELVQASRFLGQRGFVVTFHRVDPLFTLDLSDPSNPQKAGELELPGFSTYLHPIDDGHLLAVGRDAPGTDWHDWSLQLSVFDVSDLSAPARTAQIRVGSAYAYSEALWERHAFNWFPQASLVALPFADWEPGAPGSSWWGTFVSDLRVFEVHAGSIASRGALTMKDLYVTRGDGNWTWSYTPYIHRSVMATDGAGKTYVYAISDAGVRVAELASLSSPIATAVFTGP